VIVELDSAVDEELLAAEDERLIDMLLVTDEDDEDGTELSTDELDDGIELLEELLEPGLGPKIHGADESSLINAAT
jgi:hypothetical protein